MRTAQAIDLSIVRLLDKLGVSKRAYKHVADTSLHRTIDPIVNRKLYDSMRYMQSAMIDTGAAVSLLHPSAEHYMSNTSRSDTVIVSANTGESHARKDGDVDVVVLNTAGHEGLPECTPLTFRATTLRDGAITFFTSEGKFPRLPPTTNPTGSN